MFAVLALVPTTQARWLPEETELDSPVAEEIHHSHLLPDPGWLTSGSRVSSRQACHLKLYRNSSLHKQMKPHRQAAIKRNLLWPRSKTSTSNYSARNMIIAYFDAASCFGRMGKRPFQWQLDQIVTESMPDYRHTPMVIEFLGRQLLNCSGSFSDDDETNDIELGTIAEMLFES
jgi:hypothetical protein